jgi:hypothetical protein
MWFCGNTRNKRDAEAASEGVAQIQKEYNSTIMALENLGKRKANTLKTERIISHLSEVLKGIEDGTLSEDDTIHYVEQLTAVGMAGAKLDEERLRIMKKIKEGETSTDD